MQRSIPRSAISLVLIVLCIAPATVGCGGDRGERCHSHEASGGPLAVFVAWQERVDECSALRARLKVEIVLHPDDPLRAVNRLEESAGLRILLSAGASTAMNALPESRRYIHVLKPETRFADAMDILARALGLGWEVRGGDVFLGLEGEIDGWMLRRFYPVSDLLTVASGTVDGQPDDGVGERADGAEYDAQKRLITVGGLLKSIRHFIEPDAWRMSNCRVETRRDFLVVQAPGYVCAEIEAYLDALREPSGD